MTHKPTDTINRVIEELGITTPVTNADWGRMFADLLLEQGDDEAVCYALADAGEKYRSGALSKTRKAARTSVNHAIKKRGANGSAERAAHHQLAFEVSFEGVAPRPLSATTHEFLREAVAYAKRQHHGIQENLRFLQHAEHVTEPFPGQTVHELVSAGLLTAESFAIASGEAA